MMNEQQLEDLCIGWFQEAGWQFVHGPDISPEGVNPERADYRQVIMRDRLLAALARISPGAPIWWPSSTAWGQDEIAFYDALANNESAVRELGDEILKKIAVEITEKLRASTTVDWQVRESVRARLRILVRRCLQKWKYPADQQADAVELVLKQAESLSNEWSRP